MKFKFKFTTDNPEEIRVMVNAGDMLAALRAVDRADTYVHERPAALAAVRAILAKFPESDYRDNMRMGATKPKPPKPTADELTRHRVTTALGWAIAYLDADPGLDREYPAAIAKAKSRYGNPMSSIEELVEPLAWAIGHIEDRLMVESNNEPEFLRSLADANDALKEASR